MMCLALCREVPELAVGESLALATAVANLPVDAFDEMADSDQGR